MREVKKSIIIVTVGIGLCRNAQTRIKAATYNSRYGPGENIQEEKFMTKVTKDMIIGELLNMDPEMAGVLVAGGMHCVGCPSAQAETLEEAALVHGIEPDVLVARVNAFVEAKQNS